MATIKEAYVSYEVAKLLKEKGFHEPCIATYNSTTKNFNVEEMYYDWTKNWKDFISAPTQAMAMKYLREVHKLSIDICTVQGKGVSYMFNIWDFSIIHDNKFIGGTFDLREQLYDFLTYEGACEAAIKYCLENLI